MTPPYLEYSTISLLFCHEYFSLFPAILFLSHGIFVFIEKTNLLSLPRLLYCFYLYS